MTEENCPKSKNALAGIETAMVYAIAAAASRGPKSKNALAGIETCRNVLAAFFFVEACPKSKNALAGIETWMAWRRASQLVEGPKSKNALAGIET